MVYDVDNSTAAMEVASAITKAGYPIVTVITGGFDGWKAARAPVATGPLNTDGRLRAEAAPGLHRRRRVQEVRREAMPADVVILDVRNTDEANAGMIKGAILIPDEELAARMGELPKDKRIVAHCSTGVRAEMAYHKLKDAGYKVGFVYAELDIAKNGAVKLTPRQ